MMNNKDEITNKDVTDNNINSSKKNRYIFMGILIFALCILGWYFSSQNTKSYKITFPAEIEYGTDIKSQIIIENVSDFDVKLVDTNNEEIKDVELNKDYRLEITIGKDIIYKDGVKIIDITAPVINLKTKEVEIPVNHIVLNIEATATDNHDKEVKVLIDTKEVDVKKTGEYKAYVIAKDSSNNESKEEVLVKVVKSEELSETAKETVKKQVEQYVKENPESEVAKEYASITTSGSKTTSNTTTKPSTNNNTTVPTTNEKTQEQINAEQKAKEQEAARKAEEQRQAELNAKKTECEAQWGKWNGSSCTWDQPSEPTQPQPEQPVDNGNSGGNDNGCSVSAKLAEYEAYAQNYISSNPDIAAGNWGHYYEPESGQLRLYIDGMDGRSIPETRREYYCKQP